MVGSKSCYNFSGHTKDTVFVVQLPLATIRLLACLAVIMLILLFKGYQRFIYRLVIYLLHDSCGALTHLMSGLPVDGNQELSV